MLIRQLSGLLLLSVFAFLWTACGQSSTTAEKNEYFPPPDSEGGWRTPSSPEEVRRLTGFNTEKLDKAFEFAQTTSKNGGLLVARHGYLVYERYFGLAHRDATANTGSLGKSFTSIAFGILMAERPELFPDGFDQKVYTPKYLPPEAFPLSDPRKAEIKLGQLLSMSAGIRGNNPGMINGKEVTLDPAGPDGWKAMVDEIAFGHNKTEKLNAVTLWCEPGGGYSYATSSIQIVSAIVRHLSGMELEDYTREKIAKPLGWGHWGWGYKDDNLGHTAGGGGTAPRPTDMLRFLYMLLKEGRWGGQPIGQQTGQQIVPADYVRRCGTLSPYNPHSNYSFQFRVNAKNTWPGVPADTFWKAGSGSHGIYVIPSLDLVVFKFGGRDYQFHPDNTGVPAELSVNPSPNPGREGWEPTNGDADPYETTLRLVVEALEN